MRVSQSVGRVGRRGVSAGLALALWGSLAGPGCGGVVIENAAGPDGSVGARARGSIDSGASLPGSDAGVDGDDLAGLNDGSSGDDALSSRCAPDSPLSCYVDTDCPNGGSTSLTGTVYDPAGHTPLYGAVVFVPNDPANLPPIVTGANSCNSCEASIGDYVTVSVTDATGNFTIKNVPTGENVPLVVQVGKWRRVVTVPSVPDCMATPVPHDLTRLPRNQAEGHLPQMALLTGGCDNVACFLRSVGVDASEFSSPHAGGRVDVYQGLGAVGTGAPLSSGVAGDCTTDACPLWSSKESLQAYDAVLLGCECGENNQTKPAASLLAMHDYLDQGGTVFATHSQATWFKNGPAEFQSVASWTDGPASGAMGPFTVDTTFQGGNTLRQWLSDLGAADPSGLISLAAADVSTSVTAVSDGTTRRWIFDTSTAPDGADSSSFLDVKLLSFRTPVDFPDGSEARTYCGTAYFTDIHPGGGQALQDTSADGSGSPAAVPAACDGGPLTAEEKALEFLFFDQTECLISTGVIGLPPPSL